MKKSIHKLITFTVITFIITLFASMTPTLAKELTLQQLGRAIEKQDAKNKVESSYAYIIGKYVFTSNIKDFTTQDVMLAARSISNITGADGEINSAPIYGKMAIQLIERTYGSDGITATGWKISSNLIGETKLEESKIDVTYIDYNYIKDELIVDTDNLVKEAMSGLKDELFTVDTDNVKDGKITVKVNKVKESIYKGMNSGVLASLSSLVAKDGVKSVDFAYTNSKGEKVTTTVGKTINIEEIVNWFDENAETIFGKKLEDLKTYDLVGKEFTVTINLDEDKEKSYVSKKNLLENETYTINFTGEKETVNTDELVQKAMNKLSAKDVFTLSELKDGTVTATVKDVDTKIVTGMNSGIIDALQELMENADIASITFGYKDANVQAFELTKETEYDDILTWYEENAKFIFGEKDINSLTMNDVINKEFTVTINLQDYAQKDAANPTQYTVKIEATKYDVTFDYNGADNQEDKTTVSVEDGKTVTKPDDPTREGHIFDDWYITGNGGKEEKFNFDTKIKKDTELKAHWKLDIKEADYILDASKSDNGTFESVYDTNTSTVTVTITDPTKKLEDLKLAEDIKDLVEKEEVVSVTMTYNNNETTFTSETGNLDEEINDFLNKVISEEMTTRAKREVSDTNLKKLDEKEIDVRVVVKSELDNEVSETEEIDYTIKFEILTHKVTFNYNDDTTGSKTVTVDNKGKVEKKADLENPTRAGYRFDGWYNGQDKFTFDEEITEDTVLEAKWIKQHTVTFNYNGGSEGQKQVTVDENSKLSENSYTPEHRDGYRFDGWYNDQNKFNFDTPITSDLNLTAHWTSVLTAAEKQAIDEASQNALNSMKKEIIEVSVDKVNHTITIKKVKEGNIKLYSTLSGQGLRESLHNYLSNQYIKSIKFYLDDSEKAEITAEMVKDTSTMFDYIDQFLDPFMEATGIDNPLKMTFDDLTKIKGKIKVKIILANDKSFEDEADSEYTFVFTSN